MNILPDTEKILLKKGLRRRFLIVLAFMIFSALVISLVALVPSYVLARVRLTEIVSGNGRIADTPAETSQNEILSLPEEVASKLGVFEQSVPKYGTGTIIYEISARVPEGVSVESISLSGGALSKSNRKKEVHIAGVSIDRKSLIGFADSLKELETVSSVEVPVSSLAKEKNLAFALTIIISD